MIFIVSPHIDDAVFSIGGLIRNLVAENNEVEVKYIFTISNWTNPQCVVGKHYSTRVDDVSMLRAQEEELVSKNINYRYELLRFLDCPLRDRSMDLEMTRKIETDLKDRFLPTDSCFFPVGLGHPDHIIVREIGLKLWKEGYNVCFYEDLPYAALMDLGRERLSEMLTSRHLEPVIVPIDIAAKLDAVSLYESQTSAIWMESICNYSFDPATNSHHERYWRSK